MIPPTLLHKLRQRRFSPAAPSELHEPLLRHRIAFRRSASTRVPYPHRARRTLNVGRTNPVLDAPWASYRQERAPCSRSLQFGRCCRWARSGERRQCDRLLTLAATGLGSCLELQVPAISGRCSGREADAQRGSERPARLFAQVRSTDGLALFLDQTGPRFDIGGE